MENPIKMDDLGVPLFLVQHPYLISSCFTSKLSEFVTTHFVEHPSSLGHEFRCLLGVDRPKNLRVLLVLLQPPGSDTRTFMMHRQYIAFLLQLGWLREEIIKLNRKKTWSFWKCTVHESSEWSWWMPIMLWLEIVLVKTKFVCYDLAPVSFPKSFSLPLLANNWCFCSTSTSFLVVFFSRLVGMIFQG